MRIGLDLDGVFYDFNGSFRRHVISNKHRTDEQCTEARLWRFYQEWGMDDAEFMRHFVDGVNVGTIFRQGGATPGTRQALLEILDMGHTLHVITDRSVGLPGLAAKHTYEWLDEEFPKPITSVTFTADKTSVKTDMMIDDKLSNYEALVDAGVDAYLLDRPWNQTDDDRQKRVSTIQEFVVKVKEKTEWQAKISQYLSA
jgi:5'(3')-deoxyribonucleotidase